MRAGLRPVPFAAAGAPWRRAAGFLLLVLAMLCAPAAAQAPAVADPAATKAALERIRSHLEQSDATLQRPDLRDAALQQVRAAVEPQREELQAILEAAAPRVEALKARVAQLGASPTPPATESADLARERGEREKALKDAEDQLTLARALAAQADQIAAGAADRRREQFARRLFERSASPLSPMLWWQVAQNAPRDFSALTLIAGDWFAAIGRIGGLAAWLTLVAGFAGAFLILVPATRLVERYAMRKDAAAKPGPGEKAVRAGIIALLGAARPAAAAWLVGMALDSAGLLPGRIAPVVLMALAGLAAVTAVRAIAQAMLAPDAPNWRIPALADANAASLKATAVSAAAVHMTAKLVEAINQAIGAGLPLTIASRALFALLFVAVMWRALSAATLKDPEDEDECLGPYVPPAVTIAGPLRLALAAALIAIAASALIGFVALAVFLIDQLAWIALIGVALSLTLILVQAFMTRLLAPGSRMARSLHESVGLRQRSIEQIGVVAAALVKVFLWLIAALLVIAPWGVESTDILTSVRSALFGFKVGDVTISFSAIVAAATVLAIGIFLTRSGQRWLDDQLLPRTDLDVGIKNSIRTAVGYAGFVLAAALAISSLGLSLDRIAIIAGALSVGIGFGLQSIVNNFVSGLILLWERPIRVGDLIDVGGEQGVVRRINVRSTEIATGDRATLILPNSNLVSGAVKNRVHSDRTGRVLIALSVPRSADPDAVAQILRDAAAAHADVLKRPPPAVAFKKIGEATLDFELACVVPDVDLQGQVTSDLNFAILRAVGPPAPAGATKVRIEGVEEIGEALARAAAQAGRPGA